MQKLEQVLNRLIEFGLMTSEEEKIVKEELLHIEIQLTPKTQYIEFIEGFNKITGKKFKPDTISRELFYEHNMDYSLADRMAAVKNSMTDPFIKESPGLLQPKWISKPENIAKYINYKAPKVNKDGKDIEGIDYGKPEV